MLTGISNKQEVLDFFINYMDNYYQDADDGLLKQLYIAKAEELITEDVDYWSNQSVKKLKAVVEDLLIAGNPEILNADYFYNKY